MMRSRVVRLLALFRFADDDGTAYLAAELPGTGGVRLVVLPNNSASASDRGAPRAWLAVVPPSPIAAERRRERGSQEGGPRQAWRCDDRPPPDLIGPRPSESAEG